MGALEEILANLVNDRGFRARFVEDPAAALAGYDLDQDELELLTTTVDEVPGGEHEVEQRTSKSALLGLLGSAATELDELATEPTAEGDPDRPIVVGSLPNADDDHEEEIDFFGTKWDASTDDDADQASGTKIGPARRVPDVTLKRGTTAEPDGAGEDLLDAPEGADGSDR